MTHPPSALELRSELTRVARSLRGLRLRELEGGPGPIIHDRLRPPVDGALGDSLHVLGALMRRYERPNGDVDPAADTDGWGRAFDHGVDALVQRPSSAARVADLGFMARMELNHRRAAVQALDREADGWHQLAVFGGAARKIRKSLTAVSKVLCQAEGLRCELGFASELAASLEVRRAYAELRRSIDEHHVPADDALFTRLRRVGNQIAVLTGRDVYDELRVGDRAALHELHRRIRGWLSREGAQRGDEEALVQGARLWQDLAGFCRVLAQVSHRQELRQHDAATAERALEALAPRAERDPLPEAVRSTLADLRGLDDGLDRLLREPPGSVGPWRAALSGLRPRLQAAGPSASGPVDPAAWT